MKISSINSTISQLPSKTNLQKKTSEHQFSAANQQQENVNFKANWGRLLKPSNIIGTICTFGLAIPFIVSDNSENDSDSSSGGVFDSENFDTYYHNHLP